jgi:branched-chain amino acid transport system substrate-binding protein
MKNVVIKVLSIAMALGMVFSAVGCVAANTPTPVAPATAAPATAAPTTASAATAAPATAAPTTAAPTTASSGTATPQIIKIGFMTPLTGTSAALGQQVLQAATMIVDLINKPNTLAPDMYLGQGQGLPNLGGAQIQLVVSDDKSDAATAVSEAKRLITEEHIVALTGEFTSAVIKAVSVVTEQYHIPFVASGSAVTLTDGSTPLQWFFRFELTDATYIKDTFDFMQALNTTQNAGIKTVAFFSEDSEFGANIVTQEVKFAAADGFQVVQNITYPANSTDLTAEALKIKSANPDVLIMASYSSDAALLINTFIEQNYTPKMIIGQRGGFIQPDYLKAQGAKNDYILTTGSWSPDIKSAVSQELVTLYPAKYSNGVALTDAQVKDVSNLQFLAMAINQAGSTDPNAVKDAILHLKYDMTKLMVSWKGVSIDQYGQNTETNGIVTQYINGTYKVVYPLNVASVKAVYPMPAWNNR